MKGLIFHNILEKRSQKIGTQQIPFKDSVIVSYSIKEFNTSIPCPKQMARINWKLILQLDELISQHHITLLPLSQCPVEILNLLNIPSWVKEMEVWH